MRQEFDLIQDSKRQILINKIGTGLVVLFMLFLYSITAKEIKRVIIHHVDLGRLFGLFIFVIFFTTVILRHVLLHRKRYLKKVFIDTDRMSLELWTIKDVQIFIDISKVKYARYQNHVEYLIIEGKKYKGVEKLENFKLFSNLIMEHCKKSILWSNPI
jgi:hypothetical protein